MPIHRALVTLQPADSNPENVITNTWHFSTDLPNAPTTTISGRMVTFYTAIQALYSELLAPSGHRIKWYRLSDPAPRAPVDEVPFLLSISAGTPAPPEVALCMSFQAVKTSGVNQGRRRGRLFLGPLKSSLIGTGGRPLATTTQTIRDAALVFANAANSSTAVSNVLDPNFYRWVVSSSTGSSATIRDGWVDNEFDIQRRRGRKSTARTTFVVS